jgi:hypothetical protein
MAAITARRVGHAQYRVERSFAHYNNTFTNTKNRKKLCINPNPSYITSNTLYQPYWLRHLVLPCF